MKPVRQNEARVVVHQDDQIEVVPTHHSEAEGCQRLTSEEIYSARVNLNTKVLDFVQLGWAVQDKIGNSGKASFYTIRVGSS